MKYKIDDIIEKYKHLFFSTRAPFAEELLDEFQKMIFEMLCTSDPVDEHTHDQMTLILIGAMNHIGRLAAEKNRLIYELQGGEDEQP